MGLQTNLEQLMTWAETKKLGKFIKQCAIQQFLRVYRKMILRPPDALKYGDEVECLLVEFDKNERIIRLLMHGDKLCENLKNQRKAGKDLAGLWTLEYGIFMIESTPRQPFEGLADLARVEKNMRERRQEALASLSENQRLVTVSAFPRLGCSDSIAESEHLELNGPLMNSSFLPDATVTPTLRFKAMTGNANMRRGRKMFINIPLFQDELTDLKCIETYEDPVDEAAAKEGSVYMDGMIFANGCCSLQITMQTKDLDQLKELYDQFGAISPILKALSASSPIFRGFLVDVDTRWQVISQGTDDRTVEESNSNLPDESVPPRASSIRGYISAEGQKYNDVPFPIDKDIKAVFLNEGIDDGFASHLANTFSRDPMLMFEEKLQIDDEHDTFHFESVQALNYQSVRFKLPPPNMDMGWRLELRACDVQLTDIENAAFVTFVVLLSRVMSEKSLNLLMPISKVDENMIEADRNDGVRQGKFWCKLDSKVSLANGNKPIYEKLSMDAIINGQDGKFRGLIPIIRRFLKSSRIQDSTRMQIERHLTMISKRASGDYLTTAQWIRKFVRSHRDYKNDSVVSESVSYDLMVACDNIVSGKVEDPRILKQKILHAKD